MGRSKAHPVTASNDHFRRVGNDLSVDFANTVRSPDHPDGSLHSAKDVLAFLLDVEAIDPKEVTQIRKTLAHKHGADVRFFHTALQLRTAVREALQALDTGKKVPPGALETLNSVLSADAGFQQIETVPGQRFEIIYHRTHSDVAYILAPIARAVGHLLVRTDSKIRKCANPACVRYFYDDSRTGGRRWCEMAVCGNRAKVAAFLRRKRTAE